MGVGEGNGSMAGQLLARDGTAPKAATTEAELRAQRMAAVRKPVAHDHERGRVFNELTEALVEIWGRLELELRLAA